MEEVNVAVVPFVVLTNVQRWMFGAVGMIGQQPGPERAMLLTNQRTILVPRKMIDFGAMVLLLGGAGAYYADATAEARDLDSTMADPVSLAAEPHSIVVPHGSIVSLSMGPGLLFPFLRVRYTDQRGKERHVDLLVRPSPELLKERKRQGASRKQASAEYAAMVHDAYLRALPPEVATRASWRI